AVVLQPVLALLAGAAAVDDAAHAHQVARLEAGDLRADLRHPADDLVPGHAGKQGAGPLGAHLVQVRVADAAVGDLDADVPRPGRATGDLDRLQRPVAGVGAPCFYAHLVLLRMYFSGC